jgi:putative ABC transport system ATP-binding protein
MKAAREANKANDATQAKRYLGLTCKRKRPRLPGAPMLSGLSSWPRRPSGGNTRPLGQHVIPALQGVDLTVQRGELLALVGPSGSGKSTILNLCGLIDTPDSGDIALGGQNIGGLNEDQRTLLRRDALGFVFQSFNLVPVMTVAENVDYPLFLAGVLAAERKQRVAAQLAAVGLQDHAHHRPDALSGGQRQRVAIARALIKRPRLVIADEPTANLDSHTADQVLDLMRERGHARRPLLSPPTTAA